MKVKRDAPPAWQEVMDRASLPSAQKIADKTGLGVQTVINLIHGKGRSTARTVEVVATALRVTPAKIMELRGEAARTPFVLPDGADNLDEYQREAVRHVVRAMLRTPAALHDTPSANPPLRLAARRGKPEQPAD